MNDEQLKVVGHSLGINTYHAKLSEIEKDKYLPGEFYRNYFCAGDTHGKYPILEVLEATGFMERWEKFDNLYFSVTEKGIREFRNQFAIQVTQEFKPPSKGRQKYLDYLYSDSGCTFEEFLGIQTPKREYGREGVRFVSTKYFEVKGEYREFIKDARASYKEKLKAYKNRNKAS